MHYSKAYSKYGASMGRRADKPEQGTAFSAKLRKVPLDSGGYDPGGAYWGHGKPLYTVRAEDTEETFEWYFRAEDRAEAESILAAEYPKAKFRRLT